MKEEPLLAALQELMKTREMRRVLSVLIPQVIRVWAGENPLKKGFAGPVNRSLQKGLTRARDPETRLCDAAPGVVQGLTGALLAGAEAFDALPSREKEARVREAVSRWGSGETGRLLTRVMTSLQDLHQSNPAALAEAVAPAIRRWVEKTDFSALREAADTMGPEARSLARELNDILWAYPSKMVLVLSLVPDLVNGVVLFLEETLGRYNRASPDLAADLFLSLGRSLDGKSLGAALNELAELVRALHTGSALIGDSGTPRLEHDMGRFLEDVMDPMDSRAYWSARAALKEDKAAAKRVLWDALADRPDFLTRGLETLAARKNPGIHAGRHALETVDELSAEDVSEGLEAGLSDLDLQAVGDVINLGSTLLDRLATLKPDLMRRLAEQLVASLDVGEIGAASRRVLEETGEPLRPVLRALMPDLLLAFCRAMEPADDAHEARMAEARARLRSLLLGGEAAP